MTEHIIDRAKRIMSAVDVYHERPDGGNRHALRSIILDELGEVANPSDKQEAAYSAPFTTDVPQCCGDPSTCNDPCHEMPEQTPTDEQIEEVIDEFSTWTSEGFAIVGSERLRFALNLLALLREAQSDKQEAVTMVQISIRDGFIIGGINCVEGSALPDGKHQLYTAPPAQSAAGDDVLAERQRQVTAEGWTPEHDDEYVNFELERAAKCYINAANSSSAWPGSTAWPWHPSWWKPTTYRRNLVKAGALIIAAIERLDRAAIKQEKGDE